jgi:hypothetical protein
MTHINTYASLHNIEGISISRGSAGPDAHRNHSWIKITITGEGQTHEITAHENIFSGIEIENAIESEDPPASAFDDLVARALVETAGGADGPARMAVTPELITALYPDVGVLRNCQGNAYVVTVPPMPCSPSPDRRVLATCASLHGAMAAAAAYYA